MILGQGPIALAVGAGGGLFGHFFLPSIFFLSPSLWETARYRLKYCLKGPLNPKQPTNQLYLSIFYPIFFVFVYRLFRIRVTVFFATYLLLLLYNSALLKQCSGAIVRFSDSSSSFCFSTIVILFCLPTRTLKINFLVNM